MTEIRVVSRTDCQLRDIQAIAEYVASAKEHLKYDSPEWIALDHAEARLQGLSMFTALGRRG